MTDAMHDPNQHHPDEYHDDLNPNEFAGMNTSINAAKRDEEMTTAYEIKGLHERLKGFNIDELRQIPVLTPGMRLQQGATYIDLATDQREEFTAMGGMEADENTCYVPKSETDYVLWNRLIGVDNPARLDQADEA